VAAFNPLATLPFTATNALARMMLGAPGWLGGPDAPPPPQTMPAPPASAAGPTSAEFDELRREIDALKRGKKRRSSRA
jgi:hypothetical protein